MGKSGSNGNHIIIDKKKGSIMNDSEKIEAINGFYSGYCG